MSERLVICMISRGKIVECATYQWSAYTIDSLKYAQTIVNDLMATRPTYTDVSRIDSALLATGARFAEDTVLHDKYPNTTDNYGIIHTDERMIEECIDWSSALVYIDVDRYEVDVATCFNEYDDELTDIDDNLIDREFNADLKNLSYSEVTELLDYVSSSNCAYFAFSDEDDYISGLI